METINYQGMQIVLARLDLAEGTHWASTPHPGLWASVLVKGSVGIEMETAPFTKFQHGDCYCHFSRDTKETRHRVDETTNLLGVFIHIKPDDIDATLGEEWAARYTQRPDTNVMSNGDPNITALAWQMLGSPLSTNQRRLYIAGKALELLSMLPTGDANDTAHPVVARSSEIKRAHDARALLLRDLQSPPTIPELARAVGLNARRLTEVFREVFGHTPYAFLKTIRLQSARMALETDALTVAQIAHRFGYQPAHFSTEFRRHFGVSPAAILKGGRAEP